MEVVYAFDAPETFAYLEYEVACPFCESHYLSLVEEGTSVYYLCGVCGKDWTVLGG